MVGGEDGEGVGGLGFVVGVSGESDRSCGGVNGEGSGVVAVVGLEGVSDGWVRDVSGVPIGCGSGVDELSGARIFRDGSGGPRREGGSWGSSSSLVTLRVTVCSA